MRMETVLRFCLGSLVVAILFCVPETAVAQTAKKKNASAPPVPAGDKPGNQVEAVNGAGTIKKISPNGIHVVGPQGGEWILQVTPSTKELLYLAKAEVGWLKPGTYVRFSTRLDKKGKAVAPIESLRVLSPRPEYPAGVIRETVGSEFDTGDLFAGGSENKKPVPKKKKVEPIPDDASFLVTGQLVQIRDGKFSVQAGDATITGQIPASAKISIELNELHAAVGDAAEFKGSKPANSPISIIDEIKVTAAEVLKVEQPKRRVNPKSKEATAKSGDDR